MKRKINKKDISRLVAISSTLQKLYAETGFACMYTYSNRTSILVMRECLNDMATLLGKEIEEDGDSHFFYIDENVKVFCVEGKG